MRRLRQPRRSKAPRPQKLRSEEHTSELQSPCNLVCRLLLEKKKNTMTDRRHRYADTHTNIDTPTNKNQTHSTSNPRSIAKRDANQQLNCDDTSIRTLSSPHT